MSPFALFALAFVAYSVHEHQEGHARRIDLWLEPRSFTLQDDGRGMGLHREGYVSGLMATLDGPGPVQLHGIGLALIAMSSPRVAIESRRDAVKRSQTFAWGHPDAPPRAEPAGPETGTRATVDLPADAPALDATEVMPQIEKWRTANPGLTIVVHTA